MPPGWPGSSTRHVAGGHAEVDQPRLTQLVDQDVPGLDVAVDDSLAMCMVGRPGDLGQEGRGRARLQASLGGDLIEGPAADVFHHQVRPIVVEILVVNADEVRLIQARQDLPLLDDLAPAVRPDRLERELEHQILGQPLVDDPEDVRLAGGGKPADDQVLADRSGQVGLTGPTWLARKSEVGLGFRVMSFRGFRRCPGRGCVRVVPVAVGRRGFRFRLARGGR